MEMEAKKATCLDKLLNVITNIFFWQTWKTEGEKKKKERKK